MPDAPAIAARVDHLRRRYELPEAEQLAVDGLAQFPDSTELSIALGRVLLTDSRMAEAIEVLAKADETVPEVMAWRIAALSRSHAHEQAISLGQRAIEVFPGSSSVFKAVGRAYVDFSLPGKGLPFFAKAREITPTDRRALAWQADTHAVLYQRSEALALARQLTAESPDFAHGYYVQGRIQMRAYDYQAAVGSFDKSLELDPWHAGSHEWRVTALRQQYRFTEAEAAILAAIERLPRRTRLHVEHAWLLSNKDQDDRALAAVEKALEINPRSSWALRSRIHFHRFKRDFAQAEIAADEAVNLLPADPSVYTAAASLYSDTHRYEAAVSAAGKALEIDPQNAWALSCRIGYIRSGKMTGRQESAVAAAEEKQPGDPTLQVAIAWLHSEQGDLDTALRYCEKALEIDPLHEWAFRSQIHMLRDGHQFDRAESVAKAALERRPGAPDLYVSIAWLFNAMGRPDEAIAHVRTALAINPRDSWAHRSLITLLRITRRYEEAETAIAAASEQVTNDPELYVTVGWTRAVRNHTDEAVAAADAALAIQPKHGGALTSRIDFLRNARRYNQAEEAAKEAIERRPDHAPIFISTALLKSALGRHDEALSCYETALTLDPRNEIALRRRIEMLRDRRMFQAAETASRQALERRPESPDILVAYAWALSMQDREDEAVDIAGKALAADPSHSWALRSKVNFLQYANRFDEAKNVIATALEMRPRDVEIHVTNAWLQSDLGRNDDAVQAVEKALEIDPSDPWALRTRIDLLKYADRFDEAEAAAKDAMERLPDDPQTHMTVAWLASYQSRFEQALAACEKALAIDPRHESAHEWRVRSLLRLHRIRQAEQAAQAAITARPEHPDVQVAFARTEEYRLDFQAAVARMDEALRNEPDHAGLHIARSAALRSLRRCREAEQEIVRLCRMKPQIRDLQTELGWIHHDERRFTEAHQTFAGLLKTANTPDQKASAHHGIGWVAFADGKFLLAETEFRAACRERPHDFDYQLALVWALSRQEGEARWREAEKIADELLKRRAEPSLHVCLGVLSFKQGHLSSSEYHLKKALELDPYHGSHADLGALYVQMGRYDEAESELGKAIERDWYDASAHVQLGALFLQIGEDRLVDAEREFRQALAIDSASGEAAIGLAQALAKAGDDAEAEAILRKVLRRQDKALRWRTDLALARLLVQRGDKQQNPDLHAEAYAHAQKAIEHASDSEADPHFVAGVAHHRMGSLTADARGRFRYRVRAAQHLRECLKRDSGHPEAQRNLQLLEREMKAVAPAVWGGYAVASISFLLLATMWTMFFLSSKVTAVMVTVTTPVLVGLFTVAVLLPALIRLKLPGFEADLQAASSPISPGPTGQVTFGPGRFTVTTGPTGQLPRRE